MPLINLASGDYVYEFRIIDRWGWTHPAGIFQLNIQIPAAPTPTLTPIPTQVIEAPKNDNLPIPVRVNATFQPPAPRILITPQNAPTLYESLRLSFEEPEQIAISDDSRILAISGRLFYEPMDRILPALRLYDLNEGRVLGEIYFPYFVSGPAMDNLLFLQIALNQDGSRLITSDSRGRIYLFDTGNLERLFSFDYMPYMSPSFQYGGWQNLVFSPDGRYVVANVTQHMFIFDIETENLIAEWRVEVGPLPDNFPADDLIEEATISFEPENTRFVTIKSWHVMGIWDASTGNLIREIAIDQPYSLDPDYLFYGATFLPDGKHMLVQVGSLFSGSSGKSSVMSYFDYASGIRVTDWDRNGLFSVTGYLSHTPDSGLMSIAGSGAVGVRIAPVFPLDVERISEESELLFSLDHDPIRGNRGSNFALFSPDGTLFLTRYRSVEDEDSAFEVRIYLARNR